MSLKEEPRTYWFVVRRLALLFCVVFTCTVLPYYIISRMMSGLGLGTEPISKKHRHYHEAWHNSIWNTSGQKPMVWGYVDRHSAQSGESFRLRLSAYEQMGQYKKERKWRTIRGHIEVYRVGYYGKKDQKKLWQSKTLRVTKRDVTATAASLGPNWPPTLTIKVKPQWRSGYYTIDFVTTKNKRIQDVAFIIVTNPKADADILIKLSTNTYQAYNRWGGHSLYKSDFLGKKGQMVSFDRPTPTEFYRWEYHFVMWVEAFARKHKLRIDYASDFDVHRNPKWLQKYPLFVSVGHDEYWSKEVFMAAYNRIFKHGKNTLFLGANTAHWQIRYADVNAMPGAKPEGRQLICYKSANDPIRFSKGADITDITSYFRARNRLPETMLMGIAYQNYFFNPKDDSDPRYPYYVVDTSLPFFRDSGYKKGEPIGDFIGYEWDNRDPTRSGHRLWHYKRSKIPAIPKKDIRVLFSGTATDKRGYKGTAEAVYFTSKAGAKVLSAGSMRWTWGLNKPGFVKEKFRKWHAKMLLYFLEKQ